jgi:hypothetical protein
VLVPRLEEADARLHGSGVMTERRPTFQCSGPRARDARPSAADWQRWTDVPIGRSGCHVTLGRMTCTDWVALIAAHDDKHLAQLRRALDGRP